MHAKELSNPGSVLLYHPRHIVVFVVVVVVLVVLVLVVLVVLVLVFVLDSFVVVIAVKSILLLYRERPIHHKPRRRPQSDSPADESRPIRVGRRSKRGQF